MWKLGNSFVFFVFPDVTLPPFGWKKGQNMNEWGEKNGRGDLPKKGKIRPPTPQKIKPALVFFDKYAECDKLGLAGQLKISYVLNPDPE